MISLDGCFGLQNLEPENVLATVGSDDQETFKPKVKNWILNFHSTGADRVNDSVWLDNWLNLEAGRLKPR